MKRFALAITLSCVLSGSALAGEMPMVVPSPAAPQTAGDQMPTVPGEMPMVVPNAVSETALSALLSVFDWLRS